MAAQQIVADTCATLNLLATRHEVSLLSALAWSLVEPVQVRVQAQYLSLPPDDDGERARVLISLEPLRNAGLLETVDLVGDAELEAFVDAAARIDDADAACIALAGVRRLPLLTDDEKERRIAQDMFPEILLISTLDVLHDASNALDWADHYVRRVALSLRWCGNFSPPRGDSRAAWYRDLLCVEG